MAREILEKNNMPTEFYFPDVIHSEDCNEGHWSF